MLEYKQQVSPLYSLRERERERERERDSFEGASFSDLFGWCSVFNNRRLLVLIKLLLFKGFQYNLF